MRIIDGKNMVANPLEPNLASSPVELGIAFETAIYRSDNGTEQRVSRRRHPIINTKYTSTGIGQKKAQNLLEFLSNAGNSGCIALHDMRAVRRGAGLTGSKQITLATRHPDFHAGGYVQIRSADDITVNRIAEVINRTVFLQDPMPFGGDALLIYSVVPGSMSQETRVATIANGAVEIAFEGRSFPGTHEYPIYPDHPAIFRASGDNSPTFTSTRNFSNIGWSGVRQEIAGADWLFASRMIELEHRALGEQNITNIRRFIDRCQGRLRSFDMPARAVPGLITSVEAAGNAFPRYGQVTTIRSRVNNGARLIRFDINGAENVHAEPMQLSDPGPDRRQVVMMTTQDGRVFHLIRDFRNPLAIEYRVIAVDDRSDPLSAPIASNAFASAEILSRFRLAADSISIKYYSNHAADVALRVIELADGRA